MPDLKTELTKVIQAWETPEPQPEPIEQPKGKNVFAPTNNVSQETFNFVRDNSGCSRTEVIYSLVNKGYKKSSVSSLVGQMLRQGHIWRDSSGLLRPNGTQYTPIKSARTIANREKKVKKPKSYKVITSKAAPKGIDALVAEHKEVVRKLDQRSELDAILDRLTLSEAHELYRRLHVYFGGLPK